MFSICYVFVHGACIVAEKQFRGRARYAYSRQRGERGEGERERGGGDARDGNAIFVASLVRYDVHVEIPRPLLFPFPSLDNNRDSETMTRSA